MSPQFRVLLATSVVTASTLVGGEQVAWRADHSAESELVIPTTKAAELCGRLAVGEKVEWKFDGSTSLDFNIHYHEAEQVLYSAQHESVMSGQGILDVPKDQEYCWMWQNRSNMPATIKIKLLRR